MSDSADPVANLPQLKLPPILDIEAAAEMKRELLAALGSSDCIIVDASAVQRVTTPCLQVLVAAKSAVQVQGGRFRLHSIPRVLTEAIDMLGLADALGIGEF